MSRFRVGIMGAGKIAETMAKTLNDMKGVSLYAIASRTEEKAKASQCIKCGACEKLCPQHIPIREHLSFVAEEVEAFTAKTDR